MKNQFQNNQSRLSNSEQGRLWVSQFAESDQKTAKILLDDLFYISNDDLIAGLNSVITNFAEKHSPEVIALFAARENKGNPYWRNKYEPPRDIHGGEEVGSEGMIANLCRDIAEGNQRILNHPSIQIMKEKECDYLLFVDDIIASGTRMNKFAKWIYGHRTIKSWHSYGYIKFAACSYIASILGEETVLNNKLFSKVLKFRSNGNGRSYWSKRQTEEIKEFCNKYADFWPLGYKEAFTTILLSHKCPNTNPSILWADKNESCAPIFSTRPELVLSNKPILDKKYFQNRILKALGHTRLTKPSFFQKLSFSSRRKIILLSCIASGKRKKNILSDIMEMPIHIIRQYLEVFIENEWIDENIRITDLGKQLLESARKNDCLPKTEIKLNNDFYYPKSYRGSTLSSSSGLPNGDSH